MLMPCRGGGSPLGGVAASMGAVRPLGADGFRVTDMTDFSDYCSQLLTPHAPAP